MNCGLIPLTSHAFHVKLSAGKVPLVTSSAFLAEAEQVENIARKKASDLWVDNEGVALFRMAFDAGKNREQAFYLPFSQDG